MPEARHRADHRSAARKGLLGALVSPLVVSSLFVGGITGVSAVARSQGPAPTGPASAGEPEAVATLDLDQLTTQRERQASRLSRDAARPTPVASRVQLKPTAVDQDFATAPLNIWRGPREQGPKIGVLPEGTKVAVTGQVVGTWAEVLLTNPDRGRVARWVNDRFLAENKPKPEPKPKPAATSSSSSSSSSTSSTTSTVTGLSSAPCADGSSVESGLSANAVAVYRAVCAAFPTPTTYGGYSPRGEHIDGRAIDIMVSGSTGYQIAEWLRANASALKVRDVIFAQRIWTPEQAAAGWRGMSDRGSATANHYDHVHVAVF